MTLLKIDNVANTPFADVHWQVYCPYTTGQIIQPTATASSYIAPASAARDPVGGRGDAAWHRLWLQYDMQYHRIDNISTNQQ